MFILPRWSHKMYSFFQTPGETFNRKSCYLFRKLKTIVNFGILVAFLFALPYVACAAIVEGEAVDRYVTNPKYTEEYKVTAEKNETGAEVAAEPQPIPTTSPVSTDSGYSEGAAVGSGQTAVPDVPSFTPEVDQPVSQKKSEENSSVNYIVLGAIVVIIGVGIMFLVAKSREE